MHCRRKSLYGCRIFKKEWCFVFIYKRCVLSYISKHWPGIFPQFSNFMLDNFIYRVSLLNLCTLL